MYLPKSKYKVKETSAGVYKYEATGQPFEGGSFIEMSDGTLFKGNVVHKISPKDKLIPLLDEVKNNTYILNDESSPIYYNILTANGKKISKEQDKLEALYPSKPVPTPEEYLKGYYYRYFAKRINSATQYYEIDKETYTDLKDRGGRYDYWLYVVEKLRWDLTDTAKKTNKMTLRRIRRKGIGTGLGVSPAGKSGYRYLSSIFPDLEEYKLSEDILYPKTSPENINAPKPKLPLQKRQDVLKAQKGAIDLIKEKARKKQNKANYIRLGLKPESQGNYMYGLRSPNYFDPEDTLEKEINNIEDIQDDGSSDGKGFHNSNPKGTDNLTPYEK